MDFGNNVYGGGYGQPQMGYGWSANPTQQVRQMNVLTAEEIQQLVRTENKFSLALTQTDKNKAACNHRRADGTGDSLVENADGTVSCSICGYTFKPLEPHSADPEFLNAAVADIVDILQTIKMIWIDGDAKVIREYFQIIPLLEKIPKLFEIAVQNYTNHEQYNGWRVNTSNMNTVQMFNMLSGLMSGAAPQGFAYQQPQPMNVPNGYQPQMGQPVMNQPMGNPFGFYGQPQMNVPNGGYQPQMNGFAYSPVQQPQQNVTIDPAQPAPGQENPTETKATTDGATVNASATFKA